MKYATLITAAQKKETLLQPIDINLATKAAGGDEKLADEALEAFYMSLQAKVADIMSSYSKKDYKQLLFLVDYLLSGACYCGAPELELACRRIYKAINDKKDIYAHYLGLIYSIDNFDREYKKYKISRQPHEAPDA